MVEVAERLSIVAPGIDIVPVEVLVDVIVSNVSETVGALLPISPPVVLINLLTITDEAPDDSDPVIAQLNAFVIPLVLTAVLLSNFILFPVLTTPFALLITISTGRARSKRTDTVAEPVSPSIVVASISNSVS